MLRWPLALRWRPRCCCCPATGSAPRPGSRPRARSLLSTAGNLLLATLAQSAIGVVLALVLRSTAAAIAIGLAYLLVAENLLAAAWSGGDQWLPGQLLYALSKGGTSTVSYARALVLVGLYVVVAVGAAAVLFRRRDVAA